jgi:hypothetical protein
MFPCRIFVPTNCLCPEDSLWVHSVVYGHNLNKFISEVSFLYVGYISFILIFPESNQQQINFTSQCLVHKILFQPAIYLRKHKHKHCVHHLTIHSKCHLHRLQILFILHYRAAMCVCLPKAPPHQHLPTFFLPSPFLPSLLPAFSVWHLP